jgi:hypothetical protein
MRLNVYSQELILEDVGTEQYFATELVTQQADTGITYSGVRLYLHSSKRLHATPEDDDRSAITFWLPRSDDRRKVLAEVFEGLATLVRAAPPETGLD